ncbi:MAG: cyclase family protein [Candidatus Thorarchaeota archaeon]
MSFSLTLTISDLTGIKNSFILKNPTSVSRPIKLTKTVETSHAFYLPKISIETFRHDSGFIGNIEEGGSCNVNILKFSPHSLTHIETSSHITNDNNKKKSISDLFINEKMGLVYLIDCTKSEAIIHNQISDSYLKDQLEKIDLPITALAIKTKSSELPFNYDFSGENFLFFGQKAAKVVKKIQPKLNLLILDLPSIDSENDRNLLGHKTFLINKDHDKNKIHGSAIIELAFFPHLTQGYYFCVLTPPKIDSDAIITDIIFWNLEKS